jgi:hypothetical protein
MITHLLNLAPLIGGVLGASGLAGGIFLLGACGEPPADFWELDDQRNEAKYIALIIDAGHR